MKYSAVIAAQNEELMLPDCLSSVTGADEVIVIDDESTDSTAQIAEATGATVYKRKLDGFATQKNFGIDKARNNWVLIIDADERLSPELASAIAQLVPAAGVSAYSMPFRNHLGHRWLHHGGLYPDRHVRLFDRRKARYGLREIHEELEVEGKIIELDYDVLHLTYATWREYLAKVKKYSRAQALADIKLGRIIKPRSRYRAMIGELYFRFIQLAGYRDGVAGLISAVLLAWYQYRYWTVVKT